MNFEDRLLDAWNATPPRDETLARLTARVARQRWYRRVWRTLEITLTLAAIVLFGHALVSGTAAPVHWLLLPFFAVFLPVAWSLTLQAPHRHRADDASEVASTYARLRMAQLRTGLRDLWLARRVAVGLVAYAGVACLAVWWLADASWRPAAGTLLLYSVAWLGGTYWLSRRWRGRWLREYRAMRRLAA
jgi:hypothetical protein